MTKPRGNLGLRHCWGSHLDYHFGARRCPGMPLVAWAPSNQRATKSHLATRFILCSGRPQRFRLAVSGQKTRQLLDGAGQVVQPPVGVAGGQVRRRMPSQLLKRPQVDPGPAAEGQVGVAQRVEVGVERPSGPSTA